MSYTRPTLAQIQSRVLGDIESGLQTKTPILPKAVLRVLAKVFGAAIHSVYGYIEYASKQAFPDTSDTEHLDQWANVWGIVRKKPSFASGLADVTGTDGTQILAGDFLVGSNGAEYEVTAGATIASGTAVVTVEASASGTVGNLDEGDSLTFAEPRSGLVSAATVGAGGLTGGEDTESDDDLRDRLLARIKDPPQGGTVNDFVQWTLEVPGVTRAWAYDCYSGAGTVGVTFMEGDAIPSSAEVAEVAAYLETKRPVCATVSVFAPTERVLDFTISVLPNTSAVKAAVEAALREFVGESALPGSTIAPSQIQEVISGASGETSNVLSVPSANVVIAKNEIGRFGAITWA